MRATGWLQPRSTTTFELKQTSSAAKIDPQALPTSAVHISDSRVNKLQEGPLPIKKVDNSLSIWTFIASWEGNWMWWDITNSGRPKEDTQ